MSLPISPLNKGIGQLSEPVGTEAIATQGWNLLHEDLSLPAAVLYREKLEHNLEWMREFMAAYGVKLAPHGKTSMAPRLFAMQMDAGAWAITVATAQQALRNIIATQEKKVTIELIQRRVGDKASGSRATTRRRSRAGCSRW